MAHTGYAVEPGIDMGSRGDVELAMADLGPLDEDVVSVQETPEASWIVRYEDCDVEFDFEDETRTLSLATPLGTPRAERLAEVYSLLLKYNAIRRETGGITMAVMPDDRVVQMLSLADARVTGDTCAAVLRNFVTKARIWREYLTVDDVSGDGPAPQAIDELLSFGIRV